MNVTHSAQVERLIPYFEQSPERRDIKAVVNVHDNACSDVYALRKPLQNPESNRAR